MDNPSKLLLPPRQARWWKQQLVIVINGCFHYHHFFTRLVIFHRKVTFPRKDVLCLLQKWTKSQPEHAPKFSNFFSIGLCENWNQPDAICEDIFNCWWANGLRKLVWKISKIRQTKKIQGLSSLREIGEGSSRLGLKKHFHFIAAERNYILQGLNSN